MTLETVKTTIQFKNLVLERAAWLSLAVELTDFDLEGPVVLHCILSQLGDGAGQVWGEGPVDQGLQLLVDGTQEKGQMVRSFNSCLATSVINTYGQYCMSNVHCMHTSSKLISTSLSYFDPSSGTSKSWYCSAKPAMSERKTINIAYSHVWV